MAEVDIHHGARPGPDRIERRRCQLQRPMQKCRDRGWLGKGSAAGGRNILLDLLGIVGFGRSVPVVVLLLAEQLQSFGGLGEDADGFGATHLNRIGVASPGQDVGDPINGGFEPDRITGSRPGNDQLQPVLGGTAEPHEPFLRRRGGLLFGTNRVGLIDGRLQQGL